MRPIDGALLSAALVALAFLALAVGCDGGSGEADGVTNDLTDVAAGDQPDVVTVPPDVTSEASEVPDAADEEVDAATPGPKCVAGLGNPAVEAAIETALEKLRARRLAPDDPNSPLLQLGGVVVGVATTDGGYRIQAFGTSKPNGAERLPAEAVFDIGSIQKNMRWVLLHRLAELGHLKLDDPVQVDHLDLPGVTYRDLTMHVSGLRHWDDTPDFPQVFQHMTDEYTFASMAQMLTNAGGPLMETPFLGAPYRYSNYGPLIAGRAAELLFAGSDVTVRSLTREMVFEPLGLTQTTFQGYEPRPARLTPGFWADGQPHHWTTQDGAGGDGGDRAMGLSSAAGSLVYSNACDLLRYAHGVFVGNDVVDATTRADIFDSAHVATITHVHEGQSIPIGTTRSGFVSLNYSPDLGVLGLWGHFGSSQHGHSSAYMHSLKEQRSFVVLANVASDTVPTDPFSGELQWGAGFQVQMDVMAALRTMPLD